MSATILPNVVHEVSALIVVGHERRVLQQPFSGDPPPFFHPPQFLGPKWVSSSGQVGRRVQGGSARPYSLETGSRGGEVKGARAHRGMCLPPAAIVHCELQGLEGLLLLGLVRRFRGLRGGWTKLTPTPTLATGPSLIPTGKMYGTEATGQKPICRVLVPFSSLPSQACRGSLVDIT